ncbi:unnamed protein product [Blepharisma stoltei]|uniref:DinB-like domain-containing protein n=1 Tax=Blepharisma stoltei TaxID=1481888 RepID=A0AAU9IA69_9CILI|nr:unnamed protein product [Blepharisma stoltei]
MKIILFFLFLLHLLQCLAFMNQVNKFPEISHWRIFDQAKLQNLPNAKVQWPTQGFSSRTLAYHMTHQVAAYYALKK